MVVIVKEDNGWATPDKTDVMKDIDDMWRKPLKEAKEAYNMKNDYFDRLFKICGKIRELVANHLIEITFELDEERTILFINIHTDLPVKESLDLLDEIDEKYWLDNHDEDFEIMVKPKKEEMNAID